MNTNDKGNKALGQAISYFCSKGYSVSVPLNDTQPYDLIVDIEGKLNKVDVKFTSRQTDADTYFIDTTTRGHNGYEKESKSIDYWLILTDSNKLYFVPEEDIDTQTFTVKDKHLVSW